MEVACRDSADILLLWRRRYYDKNQIQLPKLNPHSELVAVRQAHREAMGEIVFQHPARDSEAL